MSRIRYVRKLTVADLGSGLGGFSEAFLRGGHVVHRYDIDPRFANVPGTTIRDVSALPVSALAGYDVILASPPCHAFSVASIGTHWGGGRRAYIPKSPEARAMLDLARNWSDKLRILASDYAPRGMTPTHRRIVVMENPRGVMRRVLADFPDVTVWLCRFGDTRAKPTDLWTWGTMRGAFDPRSTYTCHNGATDHAPAPRGSKTPGSTQGIAKGPDRSLIPFGLSDHIRKYAEGVFR